MLNRLLKLSITNSFFLFGARGTGKTSLLKALFREQVLYFDLLNLELEAMYQLDPEQLYRQLSALPGDTKFVIIDEIQNPLVSAELGERFELSTALSL